MGLVGGPVNKWKVVSVIECKKNVKNRCKKTSDSNFMSQNQLLLVELKLNLLTPFSKRQTKVS